VKNYIKIVLIIICGILLVVNIIAFGKIINERKNESDVIDTIEEINNKKNGTDSKTVERLKRMRITLADGFYYEPISDDIKAKITNVSYKENDILDYSDLRYVTVKYNDFNGETKSGELIVNVQVADDVLEIFKELYDIGYQIEKIKLIDEYNADDDASMADNNTSAFNFRYIDGTEEISDHSYGIAIDINPLYNPYVRSGYGERDVLPVNGSIYADRTLDFPHKIVKGDACYNAFISRGWKWGGEWSGVLDYQHFYKKIE
jgi:hypothetical protein